LSGTVFVTGGAGYIGSHCSKAFAKAGWTVVVFDDLSRGWREFVRWGDLIEGDIRDAAAVAGAIAKVRPDIVAHFAALAYVEESTIDPSAYYRTNVGGTLNLLDGMRASGVDKLLFSSTCATYGIPERTPIDETFVQNPINPYGRTKLVVEGMLKDFERAHGIRHVALRYFNAAGADIDGEIGERHVPETHVMPLAIERSMKGDAPFRIFGSDFDTRDGTAVRDYIHVTDLADAHCRALDYLQNGGVSDVFNIATGNGTTVAEIADAVERKSGRPLQRIKEGRRAGDPPALVASADKALEILGWKAQHSDIDNIIETAWAWHLKDGHPQ